MKEKLYSIIQLLDTNKDKDILEKMLKAYEFAYKDRCFYVCDIELDKIKNNGEIVLKAGWTRVNPKYRYSDKRNGYIGVKTIYFQEWLNPKLCEALEKHIKGKYACGRRARYNFLGKTEAIYDASPTLIIQECINFISNYKGELDRGKIN